MTVAWDQRKREWVARADRDAYPHPLGRYDRRRDEFEAEARRRLASDDEQEQEDPT